MYLLQSMTTKIDFQKNFPFITCIKSNDVEYVGIIINLNSHVTSLYDFGIIKTDTEKSKFLELGDVWWWESNRIIPINVFLKQDWADFKFCVKTMNSKDVDIRVGHQVNLKEMAMRRSKRRSITLVRRVP